MQNEDALERIVRRLDVLIALQLELPVGDQTAPYSGRIRRLTGLGLTHAEIGRIVGRSAKYVSATVSNIRKSAQAGRKAT